MNKELKNIEIEKNNIESIQLKIFGLLKDKILDNKLLYRQFYYILNEIEYHNNINYEYLSSIFDYKNYVYKDCREIVLNNCRFLIVLFEKNIIKNFDKNYKNMYKGVNIDLNKYIVNQLEFPSYIINLSDFKKDIEEIKYLLEEETIIYDDYISYLEDIFIFYESLYDVLNNFIVEFEEFL